MGYLDPPPPRFNDPVRPQCGFPKRSGGHCKAYAGRGTDHPGYGYCKSHMGNTKIHRVRAAMMEASYEARVMGLPIDIDPMEGLLLVIRITAGEVAYCTDRISELAPKKAIVRHKKIVSRASDMESYEEVETSTEVTLNIWIVTRQAAMDRFAKFCKMAIDAGVSERQVAVAEGIGQAMGHLISGVLGELGLTDAQKALAPDVVHKHLLLLERGQATAPVILEAEVVE